MATIVNLAPHLFPSHFSREFSRDLTLKHTPNSFSLKTSITYHFSKYKNIDRRPELLFWMIQAFNSWATPLAGPTRKECFQNLKLFFVFLEEMRSDIATIGAITPSTVDEFEAWLRARTIKIGHENAHAKAWKALNLMIGELRSRSPGLLNPAVVARMTFSRRTSYSGETQVFRDKARVLTEEQRRPIESVARRKIDEYRKLWLEGQRLMNDAEKSGHDGRLEPPLDLPHLGYVLVYLRYHWIATGRRGFCASGARMRLLERASLAKRFGLESNHDFYRYFLPRQEDLVPSIITVLSRTGGNPQGIFGLSRVCLEGPPGSTEQQRKLETLLSCLGKKQVRLHFLKSKTGKWQSRSYDKESPYAPTTLVAQAIEMTELSHSKALPPTKGKVWVFEGMPLSIIRMTREDGFRSHFNHFARTHNLPRFPPRLFRNSFLDTTVALEEDVTAGQIVGGHASPNTMREVYLAGAGRTKLREAIAKLQMSMTTWVENGLRPKTAEFDGFGSSVDSPIDAIAKVWLAAFTDHRLIFEGSVEKAARLLQLIQHLQAARPNIHVARWTLGFAQLLGICEDLVTRFDEETIKSARPVAELFTISTPFPPIE
jgi:hypothetical protein